MFEPMRSRLGTAVLCLAIAASAILGTSGNATAVPRWAPASTATIHPGVQTVSPSGQCTANFIFYGVYDIFIGQAAHCTSTDAVTETNGCVAHSLPYGTLVRIGGATRPGVLVYSSWITMQRTRVGGENRCNGNDFALVRIDKLDRGRVNPSIPFWGGPTGLAGSVGLGDSVYAYGNSSLRAGITQLSPKTGIEVTDRYNGWYHTVYTVSPGISGDSGSAYLDPHGRALGVLSTIEAYPFAAANNVSDLRYALAYMYRYTGLDSIRLANGTARFNPRV
jgi:hypothetical protein